MSQYWCIIVNLNSAITQADIMAWREVQDSFPHLNGVNGVVPKSRCDADKGLLDTVRRTANLTLLEEREEEKRRARGEHLYIVRALERKKERIMARQKAKEEGVRALNREKETQRNVDKARAEIEAWRANQWQSWEEEASKVLEAPKPVEVSKATEEPKEYNVSKPEEKEAQRAAAAAAKKKAKRKKAKQKAKEKKRLDRSEAERIERELALQKEKEASALKCGSCAEGIIGSGFEKVS